MASLVASPLGDKRRGVDLHLVLLMACLAATLGLYFHDSHQPIGLRANPDSNAAARVRVPVSEPSGATAAAAPGQQAPEQQQKEGPAQDAKAPEKEGGKKQEQQKQQKQKQEQQQQQQQQQGAAGAAAQQQAGGSGWFQPQGYELAEECLKHEDLYLAVVENLRPWYDKGITKADIEGCGVPVAADNTVNGTENMFRFRLFTHENKVYITSGGLRRGRSSFQGLEMHQITQVAQAAQRYGLPSVEFLVGFNDWSWVKNRSEDGTICPLMCYCKHASHFDLLLPDGHFLEFQYDLWLKRIAEEDDPVPWKEKQEKVIGRFREYGNEHPMHDRYGTWHQNWRQAYTNYSKTLNALGKDATLTDLEGPGFGLWDQRQFKYTLNLDGIGCSTRFQKILATGQTVLKQDTEMREHFYYALKPWVHYVPTGYNGLEEIEGSVRFLKEHDGIARRIGQNSAAFARAHLTEEARMCYIKVLFEEYKKLFKYQPKPEDFPYTVLFEDEVAGFNEHDKMMYERRDGIA